MTADWRDSLPVTFRPRWEARLGCSPLTGIRRGCTSTLLRQMLPRPHIDTCYATALSFCTHFPLKSKMPIPASDGKDDMQGSKTGMLSSKMSHLDAAMVIWRHSVTTQKCRTSALHCKPHLFWSAFFANMASDHVEAAYTLSG